MQIVEVTGVIALEFIACACTVERFQGVTDVLEGVAEHKIMGALQHGRLPVVLEFLESLEHREQAEVHRSHIETGNLRLPNSRRFYPLFDGHIRRTAGREINDRIGLLLNGAEKRLECFRRLVGPAVLRIAGVKMDDCGAGLGGAQCGFRDLRCRHREMGGHRRRVN